MGCRHWGRFALREVARFALLMLAVSFVTFALVAASPIDPVQANTGQVALLSMSAAKRASLAARWGVGAPLGERYLSWLGDALQGNLGTSLRFNEPVLCVLGERFANSVALLFNAWLFSGLLGFALGVIAGVYRGSLFDCIVKGYCYVLSATPTFWLAVVLLMIFSVRLGWFPLGFSSAIGSAAETADWGERLYHLVLPAITLSVTGVSNVALHTREKTIDVMSTNYVRFARTRGERGWPLIRRHGLRNLLLPALTLQCASISEIFGGSVLVEQVFSYPGLGQAAVTAGLGGDAPLLVGIALASSALVFGGNLVADLVYGLIDPRMKGSATHVS